MIRLFRYVVVTLTAVVICASSSADVVSDAQGLIGQLNPLSAALGPLIDRAAADANGVLEARLNQLNGIVQLTLYTLNQVAQQRVQDIDEKTRQQVTELNRYVSTDLLQFNWIVGKNLNEVNTFLGSNIEKFNFGIGNNISSIKFLNTVPIIKIDATGLTTLKQQGLTTELFLVGSGLKKYEEVPEARLTGVSLAGKTIKLQVPAASMGLLQVSVPNQFIPSSSSPTAFVLTLKIRSGRGLFGREYSTQSIPLRVCGALPRYRARLTFSASGKVWDYNRVRHPLSDGNDWIKVSHPSGNGNNQVDVCPGIPPSGWQIDDAPPEYGVTYASETGHNSHSISRTATGCIHLYAEGDTGDAWENISGTRIKLKRLVNKLQCSTQPDTRTVDLKYGELVQARVDQDVQAAIGACLETAAQATPIVKVTVDILNSSNAVVETRDLMVNVPQSALNGAASFNLSAQNLIDMRLEPSCRWSYPNVVGR